MSTLSALPYTLSSEIHVSWTAGQESSISKDFPFQVDAHESVDHYVARTYLQFLWLPVSIMPLDLLVPSMQRVNMPPNERVHPLHSLLEPLLLTVRACANKYHVELPQILENGGGAGEVEEMMMWYGLSYEKADEEEESWTRASHGDGPWVNQKWRGAWQARMERREVQIQILLYMLKLSLSGQPPRNEMQKKKSSHFSTDEDLLEAFMDKLSTWQLMDSLDATANSSMQPDWTQTFCESIVEQRFKAQLPAICAMLRSKVFPHSPFSDGTASPTSSRDGSPPAQHQMLTLVSASRVGTLQKLEGRARSLSQSLAQERERAGNIGMPKKRVLNREVSMSRVFKPKPKKKSQVPTPSMVTDEKDKDKERKILGVTLVEATPQKARARDA